MRRFFSLILAIMVLFNLHAYAQQVHIDIEASGFRKMKVAMPTYAGPGDMAGSVWAMCARDLALSGLFDVISPQSYVNPGPLGEVQQASLKDFSLIGADYVIAATVSRQGTSGLFKVQMIEVSTGQIIENTTFTSGEQTMYMAVHAFMDHILQSKFALDPIFSSKIACIKKEKGNKQLHVMFCDGTGGNTIKGGGSLVLSPAWSRDGKNIAFVSYWKNNPDIYLLDLASYNVRSISGRKGINTSPAFDATGSRIGLTLSSDGNPEIYLINLDGTGKTRLTTSYATDTSPSFSIDGKSMVFCSSRAGNPQIFIMDLATKNVRRLTYEGKYNSEPVFSPRGGLVVFSSLAANGKYYIATIKTDSTNFRVLPGTGLGDESPSFSPDGRLIAFAGADGNIYITDLLGTITVPITTGGGFSEPSWSPPMK
jgi:TolB protein